MPVLLLLLGNRANGVAADGAEVDFIVFAIPHMRASVVLTILRSGLLGSHIFALISGDIIVIGELSLDGDDNC